MKIKNNEQIYCIVKQAIDEWNPYHLLPEAPSDEFDRESKSVDQKIRYESTTEEITKIISTVFSSSFEPSCFSKKACRVVAKKIHDGILDMQRK